MADGLEHYVARTAQASPCILQELVEDRTLGGYIVICRALGRVLTLREAESCSLNWLRCPLREAVPLGGRGAAVAQA